MKQDKKQGKKNQIGAIGEGIAIAHVERKGYQVLEQNYLKKWGEIDVVARETTEKGITMHFIEVKTVSYETKQHLIRAVSGGTWRPEENVHYSKVQKLNRAIESWLLENSFTGNWQIDVAAVRVVPDAKYATIKYIENVIL